MDDEDRELWFMEEASLSVATEIGTMTNGSFDTTFEFGVEGTECVKVLQEENSKDGNPKELAEILDEIEIGDIVQRDGEHNDDNIETPKQEEEEEVSVPSDNAEETITEGREEEVSLPSDNTEERDIEGLEVEQGSLTSNNEEETGTEACEEETSLPSNNDKETGTEGHEEEVSAPSHGVEETGIEVREEDVILTLDAGSEDHDRETSMALVNDDETSAEEKGSFSSAITETRGTEDHQQQNGNVKEEMATAEEAKAEIATKKEVEAEVIIEERKEGPDTTLSNVEEVKVPLDESKDAVSSCSSDGNKDVMSISSGDRERASQESVFQKRLEAARIIAEEAKELLSSSKSSMSEKSVKERIGMTDYSQINTTDSFSLSSLISEASSSHDKSQHEYSGMETDTTKAQSLSSSSNESAHSTTDAQKQIDMTLASKTESDEEIDKYNVSAQYNASAVSPTLTPCSDSEDGSKYTMPSHSSDSDVSETPDKYGVLSAIAEVVNQLSSPVEKEFQESRECTYNEPDNVTNDVITSGLTNSGSTVTEKSVEVSLASGAGSISGVISGEESEGMGQMEASLDHVMSGSEGSSTCEKGSRSFEGTLESYEGTTIDSYEDTAGTVTSFGYDTNGSSILDSSFSDEFEDPLKIFNIAGWLVDACVLPEVSLDRRDGGKKKSRGNKKDESSGLKKKFESLADYVKKETPFMHWTQADERKRTPLSPKNQKSDMDDVDFGKTPKHANRSGPEGNAPDTTHYETYHTMDSKASVAAKDAVTVVSMNNDQDTDENIPISPKGSVSTTADTVQAGIRRMQLQNKVLSGARKKMEAAKLIRQRRASQKSASCMVRPTCLTTSIESPRTETFTTISEDSYVYAGGLSRNRWRKQAREYAEYSKKKAHRHHKKKRHKSQKA